METPPDGSDPAGPAAKRPAWYLLTPFLGPPPPLTTRQWRVLGLVSLVSMFENYDLFLFQLNLSRIQAELGVADAQVGWLGAAVGAGALFSILVTRAADRVGRRRLLMFTVLAYTLATGATAFAPDARWFVALQFSARIFAVAESLLAMVVIAEEFDARHRGWGIGALAAIMACGGGVAALLFSLVDVLPYGWRALYLVGLGPLLWIAWLRRTLPETGRFQALAGPGDEGVAEVPDAGAIGALVRAHGPRFWSVAGAVFLLSAARAPAGFYAPTYLQVDHGWSPGALSALLLLGGALGIVGNAVAGALSDRLGRRPVALTFLAALSAVTIVFYRTSGWLLAPAWVAMFFAYVGSNVTLSAFGVELFPTAWRSTASGARAAADAVGTVVGLGMLSVLHPLVGSNPGAIVILAAFAFLSPLLVWATFPETAGRELEEVAPDPASR